MSCPKEGMDIFGCPKGVGCPGEAKLFHFQYKLQRDMRDWRLRKLTCYLKSIQIVKVSSSAIFWVQSSNIFYYSSGIPRKCKSRSCFTCKWNVRLTLITLSHITFTVWFHHPYLPTWSKAGLFSYIVTSEASQHWQGVIQYFSHSRCCRHFKVTGWAVGGNPIYFNYFWSQSWDRVWSRGYIFCNRV